jgi:tRNA (cmo5U34)-methyltransferase
MTLTVVSTPTIDQLPSPAFDRIHHDGAWRFDEEVTRVFEDMIQRSVPLYDEMRRSVLAVGAEFVSPGSTIVDYGSARGGAIAPFIRRLRGQGRFICVEKSEPMVRALRDRFARERAAGSVEIRHGDIRDSCPDVRADLTLSVLTLQFLPVEHRRHVLREIYDRTAPGGAFILVEKVLGADHGIDELMVRRHHEHKMRNGYSREAVERRALSLDGVLRPLTAQRNVKLLRRAGFRRVDCFWRWMNFAAWLAVKPLP